MKTLLKKFNLGLLIFLLILFPLGQLSRLPLPWPEVRFYGHEVIIIVLLLNCSMVILLKQFKWQKARLGKPILFFFLIGLFSLLINGRHFLGREVLVGSLYLWRWLAYASIYFLVLQLNKKPLAKVAEYLLFAGVASAVLGLIQYFLFPNAWPLVADQWDPHVGRVMGTFLDPGFTGLIYVLTILLLINRSWGKGNKQLFTIGYLLLAICYLAFLLTYSRSAYLAFLVGIGMISWVKRSGKFFLIVTGVFLVSLLLLPRPHGEGAKLERESTISARFINYQQTWQIIQKYPLLGVGFNLYRYEQRNQGWLGDKWQVSHAAAGADNSFLFVWATTGTFGLVSYLWLWWRMIKLAWRQRQQSWGLILLSSSGAVLIHSLFNNSLFYIWIMIWLWILSGMVEAEPRN